MRGVLGRGSQTVNDLFRAAEHLFREAAPSPPDSERCPHEPEKLFLHTELRQHDPETPFLDEERRARDPERSFLDPNRRPHDAEMPFRDPEHRPSDQ